MEAAILSTLAQAGTHGYELLDQIQTLVGDQVCVDPGSTYRMLRAMEEAGLVRSSWHTLESGPSRRVYVITTEGLEYLRELSVFLAQRAAAMARLATQAEKAASSTPPAESDPQKPTEAPEAGTETDSS
ncbi:MAG: PadR family transcriptional regulator, partial [Thermoleophilia bacterium]|nr:PadR family transcriptional regulator [Thermoleophilia bacterium]